VPLGRNGGKCWIRPRPEPSRLLTQGRGARFNDAVDYEDELPVERAPWLERYGGDRRWRAEMWGSIVTLRGRYPYELEALQEGWWEHHAQPETLCALAMWRDWIDGHGRHPREELEFQALVMEFGRLLRQEGGGVKNAWVPGAPPMEWA